MALPPSGRTRSVRSAMRSRNRLQPFHGAFVPRRGTCIVAHKEDIGAQNVRSVNVHHVVRVYDIALGLRHFLAVRTENQPLRRPLCIRLVARHYADIIKEFMPEARIDHVSGDVLHTAVVPVNGKPVFQFVRDLPEPCRCAGRYSAGSTTTTPPTAAWCRSRALRLRRTSGTCS